MKRPPVAGAETLSLCDKTATARHHLASALNSSTSKASNGEGLVSSVRLEKADQQLTVWVTISESVKKSKIRFRVT